MIADAQGLHVLQMSMYGAAVRKELWSYALVLGRKTAHKDQKGPYHHHPHL